MQMSGCDSSRHRAGAPRAPAAVGVARSLPPRRVPERLLPRARPEPVALPAARLAPAPHLLHTREPSVSRHLIALDNMFMPVGKWQHRPLHCLVPNHAVAGCTSDATVQCSALLYHVGTAHVAVELQVACDFTRGLLMHGGLLHPVWLRSRGAAPGAASRLPRRGRSSPAAA